MWRPSQPNLNRFQIATAYPIGKSGIPLRNIIGFQWLVSCSQILNAYNYNLNSWSKILHTNLPASPPACGLSIRVTMLSPQFEKIKTISILAQQFSLSPTAPRFRSAFANLLTAIKSKSRMMLPRPAQTRLVFILPTELKKKKAKKKKKSRTMSLKIAFAWQFLPFSQLPWHNLPHNLIQFLLHLLEFASSRSPISSPPSKMFHPHPASLYVNSAFFAVSSSESCLLYPVPELSCSPGWADVFCLGVVKCLLPTSRWRQQEQHTKWLRHHGCGFWNI